MDLTNHRLIAYRMKGHIMGNDDILNAYIEAINKIDDLMEYRYKSYTKDELKTIIMGYIDRITKELGGKA